MTSSRPDRDGQRQPQEPHPVREPRGRSPEATFAEVDRLIDLVRDIGRELDQSLVSLSAAKLALNRAGIVSDGVGGTGDVHRNLQSTADGLERMAELVHSAMQGPQVAMGSPALSRSRPVTLGEAAQHARDVLTPLAKRHGVQIGLHMADGTCDIPAGTMYTVILNGLQNAVEAVARAGGNGRVDICIAHEQGPMRPGYGRDNRDWLLLEITDDGAGPPPDPSRVFDLGFTTKPKGSGVGLAVARGVVQGVGGSIELSPRFAPGSGPRRGAVLRALFPSPAAEYRLGGAA